MQVWVVRVVPWMHFVMARRWLDSAWCFFLWISVVGGVPAVRWARREQARAKESARRLDDVLKQRRAPTTNEQPDDDELRNLVRQMEQVNLRLTAHRVLVSSLLARNLAHGDDFERLRSDVLDGKTAATIRVQYRDAAQSYFDEMDCVLLAADASCQRTRPSGRGSI